MHKKHKSYLSSIPRVVKHEMNDYNGHKHYKPRLFIRQAIKNQNHHF